MWVWDYDLPAGWKPKTPQEWEWFLVRKINYGDFNGLKRDIVKQYFPRIRTQIDPGKRAMLEAFFQQWN
ncbi:hypothetical protein HYS11_00665 [Candidatus Gottesmanbacteria bacterium]|nr:hypothetical protein [Candidatus Gottesmanbacteria bacterium]